MQHKARRNLHAGTIWRRLSGQGVFEELQQIITTRHSHTDKSGKAVVQMRFKAVRRLSFQDRQAPPVKVIHTLGDAFGPHTDTSLNQPQAR